jgi:hypothetical protein
MSNASVTDVRKAVVQLIQDCLDHGLSSRGTRRKLQEMGIRWSYSQGPQGARERSRRQRQGNLCITGCGGYANWEVNSACFECRAAAWQ